MSPLTFRNENEADAEGIASVLHELVAAGKRHSASDSEFARAHYITHSNNLRCTVAEDEDGNILGFQALILAIEGNPYGAPVGWGVIGTHIRPTAARRGIGRELFERTHAAARANNLEAIDATIGANNPEGLNYYEAMGFRDYRVSDGAISKAFRLR